MPASEVTPPKLSSSASTPQAAGGEVAWCGDFVKSSDVSKALTDFGFFGCLIQATIFF